MDDDGASMTIDHTPVNGCVSATAAKPGATTASQATEPESS